MNNFKIFIKAIIKKLTCQIYLSLDQQGLENLHYAIHCANQKMDKSLKYLMEQILVPTKSDLERCIGKIQLNNCF